MEALKKTAYIIGLIVVLVAGFIVTWQAGIVKGRKLQKEADAEYFRQNADTVVVRDTLVLSVPSPKVVRVIDTVWMEVPSVPNTITDTVYIPLPIEQKVYADSSYRAVVSGYRPRLDSISVYPTTKYITVSVPSPVSPKRWGLGVIGGYGFGVFPDGVKSTPFIGVGVSYSLFQW